MNSLSGGTGENVMSRVVRGHDKDPGIAPLYLNIPHAKILIVLFPLNSISHVIKNRV
jgi:hypothetical protein